jgi:hypothetical protein
MTHLTGRLTVIVLSFVLVAPGEASMIMIGAGAGENERGIVEYDDFSSELWAAASRPVQAAFNDVGLQSEAAADVVDEYDIQFRNRRFVSVRATAEWSEGINSAIAYAKAMWMDHIWVTKDGDSLEAFMALNFKLIGMIQGDGWVTFSGAIYSERHIGRRDYDAEGDNVINVNLPIASGGSASEYDVDFHLAVGVVAGSDVPYSTSDFFNTLELLSISVIDENGRLVPDAVLISASGFDYNSYLLTSAVPEPRSLVLFALALAGLAARRLGLTKVKYQGQIPGDLPCG